MTNQIQAFNFQDQQVRTVTDEKGDPWFIAKDVCNVLDIKNSRQALAGIDADEKGVTSMDTPGGAQELATVNEPGLYGLTFKSRKPEAKAFRRWVTHEVLPTIRKHGMYATPEAAEAFIRTPDALLHALTALRDEQVKRRELEAKVEADKPKVLFADSVAASQTSILVGELAKLLKQNGINTGQNRLFAWMRDNDYLIKRKGTDRNMPTQRSMEMGLFEVKERTTTSPDGHVMVHKTTKVTGKGQQHFLNLFLQDRKPA